MALQTSCCTFQFNQNTPMFWSRYTMMAKKLVHRLESNVMLCTIWQHFYNFKNMKNSHEGVLFKSSKLPTLLKVTLLHECFSRFLTSTNDTKSRNASQYEFVFQTHKSNWTAVNGRQTFLQMKQPEKGIRTKLMIFKK